MSDLTWTNEQRKLSDLVPWEHNPKRMTKKQADGLRQSIEHFGFAVPFLVSPDGDIYDGHQRQTLMSAIKDYGPDATVDVRVSSRPLTDDERRELVVRLKQNQAGWDFDLLANDWDSELLVEWGFEPWQLGIVSANDAEDEWKGMPQYDVDGYKIPDRSLIVHFRNNDDIQDFATLLDQRITDKTKSLWYPERKMENNKQFTMENDANEP